MCFSPPQPCNHPVLCGVQVPLSAEQYSETKIWVPGVLIATGMSLLLGRLSRQGQEMCACGYARIFIRLPFCIYWKTWSAINPANSNSAPWDSSKHFLLPYSDLLSLIVRSMDPIVLDMVIYFLNLLCAANVLDHGPLAAGCPLRWTSPAGLLPAPSVSARS